MLNPIKKILTGMCIIGSCLGSYCLANPFSESWKNQAYNIPPFDKISDSDFMPAFEAAMQEQNKEIEEIATNRELANFENTILAFDRSGKNLRRVSAVFFGLESAQSTPERKRIAQEISPLLSKHFDNIYMNPMLFRRVQRLMDNITKLDLSEIDERLLRKIHQGFVDNGATLTPQMKDSLKKINERISIRQVQFAQRVLKSSSEYTMLVKNGADLYALPEQYMMAAKERAEKTQTNGYVFGLDNSSVLPFLEYVADAELRAQIFQKYIQRANEGDENDNKELIEELVDLRLGKANILAYPDYASFILKERMAKNPEAVYALLDDLFPKALSRAKEELKEMRAYQKKNKIKDKINASDWRYYANLVKQEKFDLGKELQSYFAAEQVRDGIFYVCEQLYGIHFEKLDSVPVPTEESQAYLCYDENKEVLGVLFLDLFARPGEKKSGAWCGSYVASSFEEGKRLSPVTTIVCNFSRPPKGGKALLTLDETETFFHEFGHALHNLFKQCPYTSLQSVARDFVELPSQIMEHWAFQAEVLKKYAKHYVTGEVIPDEMIRKINLSEKQGQGFKFTELLAASYLDMDYHSLKKNTKKIDVTAFEESRMKKIGLISQIPPRYRSTYFSHSMTGSYTAGYYSYTWSEVLDADAFEAFVEKGNIFDQETARSFRKNILEPGGSISEEKMYIFFRGRLPKTDALKKNRGL